MTSIAAITLDYRRIVGYNRYQVKDMFRDSLTFD